MDKKIRSVPEHESEVLAKKAIRLAIISMALALLGMAFAGLSIWLRHRGM